MSAAQEPPPLCFHCHRPAGAHGGEGREGREGADGGEGRERAGAPGGALLKCARCKVALYCGRDCQLADWAAGHKKACRRLAQDHIPALYRWVDENSSLLILLAAAIVTKERLDESVLLVPFTYKRGKFQITHPLQNLRLDALPGHNFEFSHAQFLQGMQERRPEDKYFINMLLVPGDDLGDRTARPIQLTDGGSRVRIGEKVMAYKVVNEINEGNAAAINDIMEGWHKWAGGAPDEEPSCSAAAEATSDRVEAL